MTEITSFYQKITKFLLDWFTGPLVILWLVLFIITLYDISLQSVNISTMLAKLVLNLNLQVVVVALVYELFTLDFTERTARFLLSCWITFGIIALLFVLQLFFAGTVAPFFLILTLFECIVLFLAVFSLFASGLVDEHEKWKKIFQTIERRFSLIGAFLVAFYGLSATLGDIILEKYLDGGLTVETLFTGLVYLIALLLIIIIISLLYFMSKKTQIPGIEKESSINSLKNAARIVKQYIPLVFAIFVFCIIGGLLFLFVASFFRQDPNYISFGLLTIIISVIFGIFAYSTESEG